MRKGLETRLHPCQCEIILPGENPSNVLYLGNPKYRYGCTVGKHETIHVREIPMNVMNEDRKECVQLLLSISQFT